MKACIVSTCLLLVMFPGPTVGPQDGTDEVSALHPYQPTALTLINGVQFLPEDGGVLFTLLLEEYLEHVGRPAGGVLGEVGLFQAQVTAQGWDQPCPLPFSGTYHDYEPALTLDGQWLVFNSRRPNRRTLSVASPGSGPGSGADPCRAVAA